MKPLTPEAVYDALKEFFPEKNDDFVSDYVEELAELRTFGIATQDELHDLLQRRAYEVMEIDRSPMSESDIWVCKHISGAEFVDNRLREGFWFSYPALLHIAMELEFGEAYEEFARKRDGLPPGPGPAWSSADDYNDDDDDDDDLEPA